MAKGFVIAGTSSGVGKTTLTLGIMAALGRRGFRVAPFKVGPDFIDPGHHAHVAGRLSHNLDGWMLDRDYNLKTFRRHAKGCGVAVVEGVMGLFDGFSGDSEAGSTAEMAKWLNLPVLLVVDAASMARSAAAVVQGFENFDPGLSFAGIVFNNLGSPSHLEYLKDALKAYVKAPFLGGLARNLDLEMPERHLGLATVEDNPLSPGQLDQLAGAIENGVDIDGLLARLPEISFGPEITRPEVCGRELPPVRIGVARDRAFCFYYPDNLELLEAAGATLVEFSPLADGKIPEDLDGLYFGGGYPELYAASLAKNESMRAAVRSLSLAGMPVYGECGGFMYLCAELEDKAGYIHPMCGCFPFRSRMHEKLGTLGYREVRLSQDTLLGKKGDRFRGHEFHYSDLAGGDDFLQAGPAYMLLARTGGATKPEGYLVERTLGSYVHVHFGSGPRCASSFVRACLDYRENKPPNT